MTAEKPAGGGLWGLVRFYAVFALCYFAFSTVAVAQYYIPSGSMRPTLEVGDRVLVNKFAYGWSRYSLPRVLAEHVPAEGRILARAPERGDIVVFRRPDEPLILIKRVVALPGDVVEMRGGRLSINGEMAGVSDVADRMVDGPAGAVRARRYVEALPAGDPHPVYDFTLLGQLDEFGPSRVPEDCFFVMGDSRDNSIDSRVWGCVPLDNLVGRAETIGWTLAWRRPDPYDARDPDRFWKGL